MSKISRAIAIAYPDLIVECDGSPATMPSWSNDAEAYKGQFYWENLDGDRFYFPSFEDAAEDVALDMAFYEEEADQILIADHERHIAESVL